MLLPNPSKIILIKYGEEYSLHHSINWYKFTEKKVIGLNVWNLGDFFYLKNFF